jgi:hypothetical protein
MTDTCQKQQKQPRNHRLVEIHLLTFRAELATAKKSEG